MAAVITKNYGEGTQGTSVPKNLKPWLYGSSFRVISDNGSIARMTDIRAPLDKLTTLKVTKEKIANVYSTLASGTVPLAEQSLNVEGTTTMVELTTVLTKTDGLVKVQLPVVFRVIARSPNDPDITGSLIDELIMDTAAIMADELGNNILTTEIMRGALTPAGI